VPQNARPAGDGRYDLTKGAPIPYTRPGPVCPAACTRRAEPIAAGTVSAYPAIPGGQRSARQRAVALADQRVWPTTGVGRGRGFAAPLGAPSFHPHSLVALPPIRSPSVDDNAELPVGGDLTQSYAQARVIPRYNQLVRPRRTRGGRARRVRGHGYPVPLQPSQRGGGGDASPATPRVDAERKGNRDARSAVDEALCPLSVAASPDEDTEHDDGECDEREDFTSAHLAGFCWFGAATGSESSAMRSPIVWADQHVLSGVQIIFQARKTPAVAGTSIIRYRTSRRPALAVASVKQDLDFRHVLELVHHGAPQVLPFSGDNDQTKHRRMGGHTRLRTDQLQHSEVRCAIRAHAPTGTPTGCSGRLHEESAGSVPPDARVPEVVRSTTI